VTGNKLIEVRARPVPGGWVSSYLDSKERHHVLSRQRYGPDVPGYSKLSHTRKSHAINAAAVLEIRKPRDLVHDRLREVSRAETQQPCRSGTLLATPATEEVSGGLEYSKGLGLRTAGVRCILRHGYPRFMWSPWFN
jgi:hypothetical protein